MATAEPDLPIRLPCTKAEWRAAERQCVAIGARLRQRAQRRWIRCWGEGAMELCAECRDMLHLRAHGFESQPMLRLQRLGIGNAVGTVGVAAGVVGWCLHGAVLVIVGSLHALFPVALSGVRVPAGKSLAAWWQAWGMRPGSSGYLEADAVFALDACMGALYGDDVVAIVDLQGRVQRQRERNAALCGEFNRIGATVQLCDALDSVVESLSAELGAYLREQAVAVEVGR